MTLNIAPSPSNTSPASDLNAGLISAIKQICRNSFPELKETSTMQLQIESGSRFLVNNAFRKNEPVEGDIDRVEISLAQIP